jgi:flavin-dependent thymidylate synthase
MQNSIKLEGWFGGDFTHAQFAWTSTGGETEAKRERIPELLKMLAKKEHGTPFEASLIHFSATVDTSSHIHLLKHRVGFSINGESARYKEYTEDKYYIPVDWDPINADILEKHAIDSYSQYHMTIDDCPVTRKRAKESARYFLPYALQINLSIACNFRAFVHFQKLRNSPDAQLEIRELAAEMLRLVKEETNDAFIHSLAAWGL